MWFSDSSFRKQKFHQIRSATYFKNVWKAPFEKCEKPWRILVIIEVFISQMTFDFQAFLYVINVLGKWIVSIRLFLYVCVLSNCREWLVGILYRNSGFESEKCLKSFCLEVAIRLFWQNTAIIMNLWKFRVQESWNQLIFYRIHQMVSTNLQIFVCLFILCNVKKNNIHSGRNFL